MPQIHVIEVAFDESPVNALNPYNAMKLYVYTTVYRFTFHTGLIFTPIEKFVGVYTIPVHSAVSPYCQVLTAVFCCNVLEYIRNNNTFLIL